MESTVQITLGDLDLMGETEVGTRFATEEFEGWGSPAGTLAASQKPRGHGAWAGDEQYAQARPIVLAGKVVAASPSSAVAAYEALEAAVGFGPVTLTVTEAGVAREVSVRRDGEILRRWLTQKVFAWSVQLIALDPRKLGDASTDTVSTVSVSGGITLPTTLPMVLGTTVSGGSVVLTNEGNAAGPLTVTFTGPLTNPSLVTVTESGTSLFQISTTIADGSEIVVDPEARTVTLDGTASRRGYVTADGWPTFPRGRVEFSFTAASGSGSVTVSARPAWL